MLSTEYSSIEILFGIMCLSFVFPTPYTQAIARQLSWGFVHADKVVINMISQTVIQAYISWLKLTTALCKKFKKRRSNLWATYEHFHIEQISSNWNINVELKDLCNYQNLMSIPPSYILDPIWYKLGWIYQIIMSNFTIFTFLISANFMLN